MTTAQAMSTNRVMSAAVLRASARPRDIGMVLILLGFILFGVTNLSAYPVVFTVSATAGNTIVSCSNPSVCDPLGVAGQSFTLSGSFDTSAAPISTGVNCSAGTNCNTYNLPSVIVIAPTIISGTVTVSNVPATITVNSGGNPDTFYTSLDVPSAKGPITVTAVVGIKRPAPTSLVWLTPITGYSP